MRQSTTSQLVYGKFSAFFLLFICIVFSFSCSSKKNKEAKTKTLISSEQAISLNNNLIDLLVGGDGVPDTSDNASKIIYYINYSRYKDAGKLLIANYPYDTVRHSGFWGLRCENILDEKCSYLFFRYENFLDNLPQEQQELMIVASVIGKKGDVIHDLEELEDQYVMNLNNRDSSRARNIVSYARKLMTTSRKRQRRVEFILANSLFDIGDINGGLVLFSKLIEENYYALPAYKRIINMFSKSSDSARIVDYKKRFKKQFPYEPLIQDLVNDTPQDIIEAIHTFSKNNNQRDLVLGRTILARHYLDNKDYLQVDSMIENYFRNFREFTADDDLVKYQQGVFFDLKMRRYYIDNKFDSLCGYALIELRENPVIEITNEYQFKNYIKFLYKKYTDKNLRGFEEFFNQRFTDCR